MERRKPNNNNTKCSIQRLKPIIVEISNSTRSVFLLHFIVINEPLYGLKMI